MYRENLFLKGRHGEVMGRLARIAAPVCPNNHTRSTLLTTQFSTMLPAEGVVVPVGLVCGDTSWRARRRRHRAGISPPSHERHLLAPDAAGTRRFATTDADDPAGRPVSQRQFVCCLAFGALK
jgi:hypothetical protein